MNNYYTMGLLSVPLSPELEETVNRLVKNGVAANKSDLVRRAIEFFAEEQAIRDVLEAEKEPDLHGDFDELASKF